MLATPRAQGSNDCWIARCSDEKGPACLVYWTQVNGKTTVLVGGVHNGAGREGRKARPPSG
jgi:hypothetical protein